MVCYVVAKGDGLQFGETSDWSLFCSKTVDGFTVVVVYIEESSDTLHSVGLLTEGKKMVVAMEMFVVTVHCCSFSCSIMYFSSCIDGLKNISVTLALR